VPDPRSPDNLELWQSDGTEAGTVMVRDIYPGSTGSNPTNLVSMNNKLYFTADNGVHGRELWDPPAVEPTVGQRRLPVHRRL
jgi:ELWxxDGT repeat protein